MRATSSFFCSGVSRGCPFLNGGGFWFKYDSGRGRAQVLWVFLRGAGTPFMQKHYQNHYGCATSFGGITAVEL